MQKQKIETNEITLRIAKIEDADEILKIYSYYVKNTAISFEWDVPSLQDFSERIENKNTHGTGCTLSSAIASHLALGHTLPEAVTLAKEYLSHALAAGASVKIGHGHGPVNHLFNPQQLKTHIL